MGGLLRAVVVFLGVLGAAAAMGYLSLVFWERTHPPRLPGFELPAAKGSEIGRLPARGSRRPM